MQLPEKQIFSEMTGTEEEVRVRIGTPQQIPGGIIINDKVVDSIIGHIDQFCPPLPGNSEFRANGARIYNDKNGVELATAECGTPEEQTAHIRANAELLTSGLGSYLQRRAKQSSNTFTGTQQRRVIDSQGNAWACHDNFSVADTEFSSVINNPYTDAARLFTAYLFTRPFITGAGMVGSSAMHFSQKLTKPHRYTGYGFNNPTLLRTDPEHGLRLEVRCNDINLFDWATMARIGGFAIVLAAAQTGLVKKLIRDIPDIGESSQRKMNIMPLGQDLRLHPTKALLRAVNFQQRLFERIMIDLDKYSEFYMPESYQAIGESTLRYCDDFVQVIQGNCDLDLLSNRADWAAKTEIIRENIRHKPEGRKLYDPISVGVDYYYDRITVQARVQDTVTKFGFGHRLAATHRLVSDEAVAQARHSPPPGTRAHDRVYLATHNYPVVGCNWQSVVTRSSDGQDITHLLDSAPRAIA